MRTARKGPIDFPEAYAPSTNDPSNVLSGMSFRSVLMPSASGDLSAT
ncbi:hypothetical protein [Burkholderia territorii]